LLAVSRSIGQWLQRDDRGSFRAWLLRIARNKAIDLLTHRSTRPFRNGDVSHLGDAKLSSICESTASNSLDDEYRWELFSQAAKEVQKVVTAQTWDAFWMTTVEGVSIEDAAGRLNVRAGVIYLSRCRIIERIKRIVKEWEGESWS
jgi:RNA polymerase sigma-70 factor, ECF subfamily